MGRIGMARMWSCLAVGFFYVYTSILLAAKMIEVLFRSCKNLDEMYCSNFQIKIERTKHDLIIKLITQMDGKSLDESIKPN